jgi:hypothetical protein
MFLVYYELPNECFKLSFIPLILDNARVDNNNLIGIVDEYVHM